MKDDGIIFAENLKRLMEREGIKAIELAERVGVSKSMVSQWLRGTKLPRTSNVAVIARVLDTTPTDLITEYKGEDRPRLTPEQRELLDLVPTMTQEEVSALVTTAKLLKAARRGQDHQG